MAHNIAFLTYDWNTEITDQFTHGIHHYIDDHPGVRVHIFTGFGTYVINRQERPALEIFNLPDLAQYDGIILQSNHYWNPSQKAKLVEKAASKNIPVVSINYAIDGTVMVGTDNYGASYELTEHLIKKHGCRSFAVVAGLSTSVEARARKHAVFDCCKANGITEVRTYANQWNEEDGVQAVREMIVEGRVPDGIVCGNDHLAYGVEMELIRNNYRVPEDVKVTGFDDVSLAVAAPSRITTVNRDFPGMIYTALDVVSSMIQGHKIEGEIYTPAKIRYSCSCGCRDELDEVNDVKMRYLCAKRYIDNYNGLHKVLSTLLGQADSLSQIAQYVEDNMHLFRNGEVYVVLNELYLENFSNTNPVRHYGDRMALIAAPKGRQLKCDEAHIYATFSRRTLLPEEIIENKDMVQVYSLQSDETCIGYVVTDGFITHTEYNFLETTFSLIGNSIERVRRASVMESLNGRLSKMYITDPLTGLYNRFGLEQKGKLLYSQLMECKKKAYICFLDIDNLKHINDTYGHESGDDAIVYMSKMIERGLKNPVSIAMRYGGDEFVILGDASMIADLEKEQELAISQQQKYPYKLSASIGEFSVGPEDSLTLQQAIERADDIMYEEKKKRKCSVNCK